MEVRTSGVFLEFVPFMKEGMDVAQERSPVPTTETVRVMGVLSDQFLAADRRCAAVLLKANLRHGSQIFLARRRRGYETGILRVPSAAIITSLLRYGIVVTGSCLTPDLFAKTVACATNMAARRALGLDRAMRTEALQRLGDAPSFKNLYILRRAGMLDSARRARESSVRVRVRVGVNSALDRVSDVVDSMRLGYWATGGELEASCHFASGVGGYGKVCAQILTKTGLAAGNEADNYLCAQCAGDQSASLSKSSGVPLSWCGFTDRNWPPDTAPCGVAPGMRSAARKECGEHPSPEA